MKQYETQEQFDANVWWISYSPAERIELRDKYLPGAPLIDMSTKSIEIIWNKFKEDNK